VCLVIGLVPSPPFMTSAYRFSVSLTYLLKDFSQMTPPPLYLVLQVTPSYIKGASLHVFTLNLMIVKKLCISGFVRLESSHSGFYLDCVSTSSGGFFTTHLGVPPSLSGVITFFFYKLSSSLHHFYSFLVPLFIPYMSFSTLWLVFALVLFFIFPYL